MSKSVTLIETKKLSIGLLLETDSWGLGLSLEIFEDGSLFEINLLCLHIEIAWLK